MRAIQALLAAAPPVVRWGVLGGGALLLVLAIGAGVWTLLEQRHAAAERALAGVLATYAPGATPGRTDAQVAAAATALRQFLATYPRSRAAARAYYHLGAVEAERRSHDAALEAFGEAARRDAGSVGALSRLGMGYAWEAKGEPARALEVYREALTGREPRDFLYGDLLLGVARVQEQLKQPAQAIEAYQRFLKDLPESPRAADVRLRLAILGTPA